MTSAPQNLFPRTQNAPLVPIFLAVVVGILVDAAFSPGQSRWLLLLTFSCLTFITTKATAFVLQLRRPETRYYFDNCPFLFKWNVANWALHSILFGGAWLWLIVVCLAGWRHDSYYNYYPEREIGLRIPEEGVASIVELRVLKTATLHRSKLHNTVYGEEISTTFLAEILRAQNGGVWEEYSGRVATTIGGDARFLHVGDVIRAPGRFSRPKAPDNPGDFDRRFYYRAQRT